MHYVKERILPPPDIGRIDAVIDSALDEARLAGAVVLVAADGRVEYRRAAGLADRELGRIMREDAIFRYSSLTKPIVTAAAMALIEAGRLSLDDAVTRWLPAFRPPGPDGVEANITIRQLLTHTAGLAYAFLEPPDGPYHRAGVSDGLDMPGLSMEEQLRRLASVPLLYPPGTNWGYSLSLDVLGAILSRVMDLPLADVVRRLVTGPLGMTDTDFGVRDHGRLAVPYVDGPPPRRMGDPQSLPLGPDGSTSVCFSPSRILDERSFHSGGAGMAGTAGDFLTFLETLRLGGRPILKPESVRAMMSNQIGALRVAFEAVPAWGFGFGGAVLVEPRLAETPQSAGTWKWGGVYGHHWFVDPVERLTVVALTNTAFEGTMGRFAEELLRAVYARN